MTTLSTVSAIGPLTGRPSFGIAGRKYFATDTNQQWYDTGSAWVNITPGPSAQLSVTPSAGGNFTIAHGLGKTPKAVQIYMTSGGSVWFQSTLWDSTYIYLTASDAYVTAVIQVYL